MQDPVLAAIDILRRETEPTPQVPKRRATLFRLFNWRRTPSYTPTLPSVPEDQPLPEQGSSVERDFNMHFRCGHFVPEPSAASLQRTCQSTERPRRSSSKSPLLHLTVALFAVGVVLILAALKPDMVPDKRGIVGSLVCAGGLFIVLAAAVFVRFTMIAGAHATKSNGAPGKDPITNSDLNHLCENAKKGF